MYTNITTDPCTSVILDCVNCSFVSVPSVGYSIAAWYCSLSIFQPILTKHVLRNINKGQGYLFVQQKQIENSLTLNMKFSSGLWRESTYRESWLAVSLMSAVFRAQRLLVTWRTRLLPVAIHFAWLLFTLSLTVPSVSNGCWLGERAQSEQLLCRCQCCSVLSSFLHLIIRLPLCAF